MPRGESRARIADGPCLRCSAEAWTEALHPSQPPSLLPARGLCSHLFSLFLADALNDAVGQDLVPQQQPLS